MQDRYAGDIGDYSKFILLKKLFPPADYSIGLVWYRYPDESHNGDGRHVDYLRKGEYRACDAELIDGLARVIDGRRSVRELERNRLLPANTVYFSEPLNFHLRYPRQTRAHKMLRRQLRRQWLQSACAAVDNCNVVVLDPDNGLQVKSCPAMHQKKSGKYAYYAEVQAFFEQADFCVIYHHLDRTASHAAQIQQRANALKSEISGVGRVFALRFFAYSARVYFILAHQRDPIELRQGIRQFMAGACGVGWHSCYEAR